MFVIVLIMLLVCIGIPLSYAWRVFRLDEPTKATWLLLVADAAIFVTLVLLVGRWDMAGYYTRFAILAVFLAAVLWSFGKHLSRPWLIRDQPGVRRHWPTLVSLVLFGGALAYVIYGILPPSEPHELALPLEGGRFMVGQGGGIGLLNRHAGHRQQRYAADITAINTLGYRADGLVPKELGRYEIYGTSVLSPCTGAVTNTRNDLPDLTPPQSDVDNPRGNHVIIDCGGFIVELAHLQQGSVAVSAGNPVLAGEVVGKVGNSGNTTEPHLHLHAVDPKTGMGVPISSDGRVPFRNRLYVN